MRTTEDRSGGRRLAVTVGALAAALFLAAYAVGAQPAARSATGPKAYVGLFKDDAVVVLDTATDSLLGTIPVPPGPHGVVVTPDGKKVYVSSDGASTVSAIDTATDQVTRSIEVGPTPHGLAISPDGSEVLVSGFGSNQAELIDTHSDEVIARFAVPQPHNSAISPDGRTAYVGSQQQGATGLVILDLASRTQVGTVPLDKAPRALNFSPDGKQLYFTVAGANAVQVLDPASNRVVAQVPVGVSPHHPLFTPDGDLGLVVSQGPGELDLLAPDSNTVSGVVKVGSQPHWIATSSDGRTAYVTNEGSNDLSVVDLASRTVTATIPVGNAPRKIAIQPASPSSTAPYDESAESDVDIKSFSFAPADLTVPVGATVTWTNDDGVPHTVIAADGSFSSPNLAPGSQFSYTFTSPGAYAYHCSIHPFMAARVVVQ